MVDSAIAPQRIVEMGRNVRLLTELGRDLQEEKRQTNLGLITEF